MKISAKNQLEGLIQEIKLGEVNCEVVISIGADQVISSIVTLAAAKELQLEVGQKVTALIKANDVLLGLKR
ncbi:MAG: TOBE domain-containing protein [Helicobacteraceae bacterium]|nr:TOBE domain-containing protein [Helicobacteraceae bacterium]